MTRATVSGIALAVASLATLFDQFAHGQPLAAAIASLAMVAYVMLEYRQSPRAARAIVVLALLSAALLWPRMSEPWKLVREGIVFGTFLSTFFVALGFVRMAAEKSARIERAGRQLLAQPAGRRYLVLTLGSNLFGLILSMGVIGLLGSMVKRGNEAPEGVADRPEARRLRERRAMMAIQRGFAMVPTWSPLSLPIPIVLTAIPTLKWEAVVPAALAAVLLLLAVGWIDDQLSFRNAEVEADGAQPLDLASWWVHVPFLLLILGIFGASVLLEKTVGSPLVLGMMACAPTAALLWVAGQGVSQDWRTAGRWLRERVQRQVTQVFPQYRTEIIIMFMAGFFGVLIRATLPKDLIPGLIDWLSLSPRWLPAMAYLLVIVLSNLAIHPMMAVIILSAAMPGPDRLGIEPLSMALAYLCGWGVGVSASPYTVCNLMIGQFTDHSAHYIAYRWNGRYLLAVMLLGSLGLYWMA